MNTSQITSSCLADTLVVSGFNRHAVFNLYYLYLSLLVNTFNDIGSGKLSLW